MMKARALNRAVWLAAVISACLAVLALSACGEDDKEAASGRADKVNRAEKLCRDYRDAVTNVRFDGTLSQRAADFRAAAEAARAAAQGTGKDDLVSGGADYLMVMKDLANAYEDAAQASQSADQIEFFGALDIAEQADDALNSLAEDGGLDSCALLGPQPGETGVSQSGFPAMMLPKQAYPPAEEPTNDSVTYPLGNGEQLGLDRVAKLKTGTVPVDEAAEKFEGVWDGVFSSISSLEPVGDSGNHLVEMRKYRYEQRAGTKKAIGTALVFSGQGAVWALDCGARAESNQTSPELEAACDRAVATLGFLMF